MEKKKTLITLLMDVTTGYVFTLGLWNQPYIKIQ